MHRIFRRIHFLLNRRRLERELEASPPGPEYYVLRGKSRRGIPGSGDPDWWRRGFAVVRTTLPPAAAVESLRAAIHQVDPALPVHVETMAAEVDRYLARPRFQTAVLTVFALTGLALAGIGLYGLISYLVAGRTRDIGLRIALGASAEEVMRMVLSDAGHWTLAGAVIGAAASAASLRLFQSLLYGVTALDSRAFAAAIATLTVVAVAAAWIPARRASRIDPAAALREE